MPYAFKLKFLFKLLYLFLLCFCLPLIVQHLSHSFLRTRYFLLDPMTAYNTLPIKIWTPATKCPEFELKLAAHRSSKVEDQLNTQVDESLNQARIVNGSISVDLYSSCLWRWKPTKTFIHFWTLHIRCSTAKSKQVVLVTLKETRPLKIFDVFQFLPAQMPSDGYWAAVSHSNDLNLGPASSCV